MTRTPEQTSLYNAVERICALHAQIPEGYVVTLELRTADVTLSVTDPDGDDVHFDSEYHESALASAISAAVDHAKENA